MHIAWLADTLDCEHPHTFGQTFDLVIGLLLGIKAIGLGLQEHGGVFGRKIGRGLAALRRIWLLY